MFVVIVWFGLLVCCVICCVWRLVCVPVLFSCELVGLRLIALFVCFISAFGVCWF